MKTKRLLSVLLVALMIVLSACGKSDNSNTSSTSSTQADVSESDIVSQQDALTAPVGLSCDITNEGTVSDQAPALGAYAFISDGETYTLPLPVSTLTEKGLYHTVPEEDNSFKAQLQYKLLTGFSLYRKTDNEESVVFRIYSLSNPSAEPQPVENCKLTGVEFRPSYTDWVLPGGITKQSTAANVLRIYGVPGKNANAPFTDGRVGKVSSDSYLKYSAADGMVVEFYFNEDGTINRCGILNEKVQ